MDTTTPVETYMSPALQDALVEFYSKAIIIKEEGKANYGKYATYEQIIKTIRPLMKEQGLFFQHISHPASGGAAVETVIYGHGGQLSSGIVRIPASKQDEHKYGGAITYAKRYSLNLALGLGGDPDLIEESAEKDLPTVVEAKQEAKAEVPEKSAKEIRNETWAKADIMKAKDATDAMKRYKAFANKMRNLRQPESAITPTVEEFSKWVKERFGE